MDIPEDVERAANAALSQEHSRHWEHYDDLHTAIASAILAERERCAGIADAMAKRRFTKDMREMLNLCAAEIRNTRHNQE